MITQSSGCRIAADGKGKKARGTDLLVFRILGIERSGGVYYVINTSNKRASSLSQ